MKYTIDKINPPNILVSPSLLACNFSKLANELSAIELGKADMAHLDIMDGHFVPNLTIGPAVVSAIRPCSSLLFDVHLMLTDPINYIDAFVKAGANHITFHIESNGDKHLLIQKIKNAGCSVGITLNPQTPPEILLPILSEVDLVLVMTVEPGFGGQKFDTSQLPKISYIRKKLNEIGKNTTPIQVDGGITMENAKDVVQAGANIIVAGTAIFRHKEGIAKAIEILHKA